MTPEFLAARAIKPWKYDLDRISDYFVRSAEATLREKRKLHEGV